MLTIIINSQKRWESRHLFSEIEREYKKGLQQKRFIAYYWPCAALVVVLAIVFALVFSSLRWLIYGCAVIIFCMLAIAFLVWEYHHAGKLFRSVRISKTFSAKLAAYYIADDKRRIDNLVDDLARHQIRTKDDILLTLNYFQTRLPGNTKPNLLGWVLTAVITLSSIVIVAYDGSIGTINLHRLIPIFGSTLVVALLILTPVIIAKIISTTMSISRNKIDSSLVEDLAYIYVHFDQYHERLVDANDVNRE